MNFQLKKNGMSSNMQKQKLKRQPNWCFKVNKVSVVIKGDINDCDGER